MAQIQISDQLRDELRAMKVGNETYDDVISRLVEDGDGDV